MRASVVAASSVNASLHTANRRVWAGERDLDLYDSPTVPPRGTRAAERPPRIVISQSYEEYPRRKHRKNVNRERTAGQIPFPQSNTSLNAIIRESSSSTSPSDQTSLRSSTNTISSAADVASEEGILIRCFAFLKHVGTNLIMPPYTTDEGLNNVVAQQHGYITLDASATKIPLV